MGLYDKIFKPKKLVLANGKVVEEKCSRAPLIIILIVIATWISVNCLLYTSPSPRDS